MVISSRILDTWTVTRNWRFWPRFHVMLTGQLFLSKDFPIASRAYVHRNYWERTLLCNDKIVSKSIVQSFWLIKFTLCSFLRISFLNCQYSYPFAWKAYVIRLKLMYTASFPHTQRQNGVQFIYLFVDTIMYLSEKS